MEIVQIFSPNVLLKDTNKYLVENIVKFQINLIDVEKCVSYGFHRISIPLHLWNQKFIEFFPKDQKKASNTIGLEINIRWSKLSIINLT